MIGCVTSSNAQTASGGGSGGSGGRVRRYVFTNEQELLRLIPKRKVPPQRIFLFCAFARDILAIFARDISPIPHISSTLARPAFSETLKGDA